MAARNQKKGASWGLVIFCIIIFWPLGVIMLIRKLNNDRTASFASGVAPIVIGVILLLSGLGNMFNVSGSATSAAAGLFLFGGGAYVLYQGIKMNKRGKSYRRYIQIVVNEGVRDVNEIARRRGVNAGTCRNDLYKMIHGGFFTGHIDDATGQLILMHPNWQNQHPGAAAQATAVSQQTRAEETVTMSREDFETMVNAVKEGREERVRERRPAPEPAAPPMPKVIQCKNCGANNNTDESGTECEYCGSSLA